MLELAIEKEHLLDNPLVKETPHLTWRGWHDIDTEEPCEPEDQNVYCCYHVHVQLNGDQPLSVEFRIQDDTGHCAVTGQHILEVDGKNQGWIKESLQPGEALEYAYVIPYINKQRFQIQIRNLVFGSLSVVETLSQSDILF
jgi:hypothetical protein